MASDAADAAATGVTIPESELIMKPANGAKAKMTKLVVMCNPDRLDALQTTLSSMGVNGVGTMLIERDILVPAREKYGIDIFGDAIDMARENAALAGEKINFIHRDYFDFKHDYKFDEIVTNMPVKGKKAKEDMDAFYARFFEKSKSLLAEDGIIIMYSNEVGFVKKQLRLQPCYRLIQEYTIRKKDSYCLFIIGMK